MSILRISLALAAVCVLAFTAASRTSVAQTPVTPCIPQNGAQYCSEASVQQAVISARSIAIESGPRDKVGESQLRSFVTKLGRSLALDTQSADLTLKLLPVEQSGVIYGAGDRELARLEVYAPVGPASRTQVIWVEKLSGPADLTWPAAVARLLEQFKHRVKAG